MEAELHPDPYGAFSRGMTEYSVDGKLLERAPTDHITVLSGRSLEPSLLQPFRGKRFAVKDIFDIRGLKTGACCKSYEACYAEAKATASIIQKLIDAGADCVGKTKTTQLASGLAARDWVDYQCPLNPRGDGHQDPDCSSAGSAVAVAAYPWLDFAVGSDTLGSMVGPAAANGIYGIRPTHGLQARDGTLLVSALFDTAGIFCRNINDLLQLTKFWYDEPASLIGFEGHKRVKQLSSHRVERDDIQELLHSYREQPETPKPSDRVIADYERNVVWLDKRIEELEANFPSKILFAQEKFNPYLRTTLEVMMKFVSDLEQVTSVHRTPFDLGALWNSNLPPRVCKPVDEYLQTTLAHIQLYDSYRNNEDFRRDHQVKFGREPDVEPMVRYKWNLGAKLTAEDYRNARNERETFRKFLLQHVFTEGTVMLLPGGYPDVIYRDDFTEPFEEHARKFQGFGIPNTAFSVLGGLPCISFPVGQEKYRSKATNQDEYRPVSLWLLGAPGTDSLLISLVKRVLEACNRPLSVKTGKTAF